MPRIKPVNPTPPTDPAVGALIPIAIGAVSVAADITSILGDIAEVQNALAGLEGLGYPNEFYGSAAEHNQAILNNVVLQGQLLDALPNIDANALAAANRALEILGEVDTLEEWTLAILRAHPGQNMTALESPAGLASTGQIDLTGAVGALLDLTTIPAYIGRDAGTPTRYFALGWVAFGTAEGVGEWQRIHWSPALYLPVPAGTTRLHYQLGPGVAGTGARIVLVPPGAE